MIARRAPLLIPLFLFLWMDVDELTSTRFHLTVNTAISKLLCLQVDSHEALSDNSVSPRDRHRLAVVRLTLVLALQLDTAEIIGHLTDLHLCQQDRSTL